MLGLGSRLGNYQAIPVCLASGAVSECFESLFAINDVSAGHGVH